MDELKEEQQIAVAETARCGGTKKTRFRRVATKVFEQGYRVCYLLGMQTLRTGRALERRLTKLLTPAVRAVRRGAARMAARLSGWLQRSGRTLRGEFAQAGRLVREAWQRHPVMGILQALKLPVLAGRRQYGQLRVCFLLYGHRCRRGERCCFRLRFFYGLLLGRRRCFRLRHFLACCRL